MGPPRDVVPAVVPLEKVVASTDEVAVYLSGFWVYPAGFEFEALAVGRDEESGLDPFSFDHSYAAEKTGEIPLQQLRLGFEFGDGSKVTNTSGQFDWEWVGNRPAAPIMSGSRGQSGEGRWSETFWVWPLPPAGSLTFVCEWPAAEIPLTRSGLDAAAIIEAASRAQRLFEKD